MQSLPEHHIFLSMLNSLPEEERTKVICEAKESLENTGFKYTMSIISGKYKMTILYTIAQFGVVRTNEMQRYIGKIPYKTLCANLKELEADGLVIRSEYAQVPPKVEYSLSDKGKSLIPLFNAMCEWGYVYRELGKNPDKKYSYNSNQ